MIKWGHVDILWMVLLVGFLLVAVMATQSYWLTQLWVRDSEKASPYECGFDPFGSARCPFSVRFYMVAILFLVFEVESLMFFPVLHAKSVGVATVEFYSWCFLLVLVVGLLYELYRGALEWSRD
ncbi:NADH dehydrogenase subunit 3 (mitochondrion) [Ylistrum balloti]|uniref:NADH dehydrogenase subunit 3 n=1 Tax=Ylistrum balloti TaxID=509963 RepID=UPI00226CCC03|nr:NADH dehydrogenase subunit 3 [Ylistrum balloti]UZN43418.1 NADH dehydrogenase subunit 3 [Ylistrum balloti]